MKAVIYEGVRKMDVSDQQRPAVQGPKDALLRVTTSAICGSDLHMYEGRTPLKPGQVVGHEIMGVIEDVGEAVGSIRKGDRVVLPFNIACGFCYNCHRGYTNMCLTMNPEKAHAAYGYAGMGPYKGGQAEYVLVPNADFNCLKVPGQPFDQWEDDFILLADVFPTGYFATELARVAPGRSVAIFGAGPVGLMAALSSVLKGAAETYVIDFIPERLDKARKLGAIPINVRDGDPVEQIFKRRQANAPLQQSMRPGEVDKLKGVDCAIDAVGYQARDDKDYSREKPTQVIDNLIRVVNPAGHLAKSDAAKLGVFPLPMAELFDKAVSVGMGQCPVKRYNEYLRDLIVSGRAKPSKIVSHRIHIEQAPNAYQKFDERSDGYTKVVIKFDQAKAA